MDTKIPTAEHLLDIIPCGLLSFDANALVLYSNQVFQDFMGYTAQEITGQKLEQLLTLPGRVFFQTHLLPLLRLQNTVEEVYVNFKAKSGQSLPMLLNGRRTGEGEYLIIHCTCFPLNHRIRYEEQLLEEKRNAEARLYSDNEERNKQKLEQERIENNRHLRELKNLHQELLQFQKLINHDITEQIRKIQMFTGLLFESFEQKFTPQQKGYRTTIGTSIDKIRHLFDHLLQFIALTEKQETSSIVELNKIIHQVFATIQSHYPDVDAELVMDNIPLIKALPIQMEKLFMHLLDNSFKFRKKDVAPKITLHTCILPYNSLVEKPGEYRYQEYLQILYTDNSRGFEEKYKEEVFMLMNRITGESNGGLGLAFCKKIVHNHHGFIGIYSAPQEGVQVKIYLPV